MIASAIEKAVAKTKAELKNKPAKLEKARVEKTNAVHPKEAAPAEAKATMIHSANASSEAIEVLFRNAINNYGTADSWFIAMKGKSLEISRNDFKIALVKLGLMISDRERAALRKSIACNGSKVISLKQLKSFVDIKTEKHTGKEENCDHSSSVTDASTLCSVPRDVPSLPASYHKRDGPLLALIEALLPEEGSKSNSVNVTLQGMVLFAAISYLYMAINLLLVGRIRQKCYYR
jgi:hypothetical protein